MSENSLKEQRIAGYEAVLTENMQDPFEKKVKEKIFKWWANWVPDYEGWCKIAEWLYAPDAEINAIGDQPQLFSIYEKSMKGQRDFFAMDMGPIEDPVTEGDTIAFHYRMYLTPKVDYDKFKKGETKIIKVTEFNTFSHQKEEDPQVCRLTLISSGL